MGSAFNVGTAILLEFPSHSRPTQAAGGASCGMRLSSKVVRVCALCAGKAFGTHDWTIPTHQVRALRGYGSFGSFSPSPSPAPSHWCNVGIRGQRDCLMLCDSACASCYGHYVRGGGALSRFHQRHMHLPEWSRCSDQHVQLAKRRDTAPCHCPGSGAPRRQCGDRNVVRRGHLCGFSNRGHSSQAVDDWLAAPAEDARERRLSR